MNRSITPDHYLRRSQLYRRHQQLGATFQAVNGNVSVTAYTQTDDELQLAKHLGLTDLSTLPRLGYKGHGAPAWLQQQGVKLPGCVNRALGQDDGCVIAQLSEHEQLILSDLNQSSSLPITLQKLRCKQSAADCYPLPRDDSHCWFVVTGAHTCDMLAKICGVDISARAFHQYDIAQTFVARVNAILIRCDLGTVPGFYVLSDSSSAEYLWDCLLDAMQEFEGSPVGLTVLQTLLTTMQ